jgi:copper(I)-binding protein
VRAWRLEIVLSLALIAGPAMADDLSVRGAWMRAMPGNLPAAGYFTLHNSGSSEAILTGAQSPACGMLMLHKSTSENGMAGMMDMPTVSVPAGGEARFVPGGLHLMCMDPRATLKPGRTVPVRLQFAGGKAVEASFAVKTARGR